MLRHSMGPSGEALSSSMHPVPQLWADQVHQPSDLHSANVGAHAMEQERKARTYAGVPNWSIVSHSAMQQYISAPKKVADGSSDARRRATKDTDVPTFKNPALLAAGLSADKTELCRRSEYGVSELATTLDAWLTSVKDMDRHLEVPSILVEKAEERDLFKKLRVLNCQ